MRQLLRDERELLMLLGLCLLLFLSVAQFVSTLSIYATEVVGITRNSLGFLYTLNGAIVIVFQMPFNRLLDQWNLRLRIAAGALIYVVAFAGFALSAVWLHLALSIGLMTVGEILAMTAISSLVSQLAPVDRIGRYMGTLGLAQGLGWAVGPYFGSVLFAVLKMQPLMLWGVLSLGAFVAACGFAVTARFGSSHKAV